MDVCIPFFVDANLKIVLILRVYLVYEASLDVVRTQERVKHAFKREKIPNIFIKAVGTGCKQSQRDLGEVGALKRWWRRPKMFKGYHEPTKHFPGKSECHCDDEVSVC